MSVSTSRSTRRLVLALLVGCALLASGAARAKQSGVETWYAQALTKSALGINVTYYWSKGPKLRAETVIDGHKVVTLVNERFYYAIDAARSMGLAIRRTREAIEADNSGARPFGRELELILEQGGELVKAEELGGRMCDVYRVTDWRGRRQLWVTQGQLALPVRVEVYERDAGETRGTDYLDWRRGLPLDDAFFEPDSSFELERLDHETYLKRSAQGAVGPVPVLFPELLHGKR